MEKERNIVEEFNHLQKHWERTQGFQQSDYEGHKTERRAKLASIILEFKPKSVLELGCFGGYNLREIYKQDPTVELTGLDINKNALDYAKSKLSVINTIHSSIYHLEKALEGKKYDVIFSAGVLIHIPCWDKVESKVDTQGIEKITNDIYNHSNLGAVHAEEHGEEFFKLPKKGMRYVHNYNKLYEGKGTVTIEEAMLKGNGFENFIKVVY